MDGKVLSGESDLNKAKTDKSLSVCFTSDTSGKMEDLNTTLNALTTEASEKVAGKATHKIRFVNEGRFYTLSCIIPATKKLAEGFTSAMGELLQTKKQLDKKAKAELKDKASKEEKVEKEDKKEKTEKADQAEKVEKTKTTKKAIAETAKKVKKIKLTEKQKQEFLDEDLKASSEKNTEVDSQDEFTTEKKYIPSHLISNSHK